MKRQVVAFCVLFATPCPGFAANAQAAAPPATAASQPSWNTTLATEFRYFSWQGTRGVPNTVASEGHGSEFYIPYAAQIVGRPNDNFKIELLGRGGWVWARQSTAGLTGEVAATTDTVMSGTVTYFGWNGIQPFVSLSSNLPTGRSALYGSAANARMDPDLVDISTFGEGFNIGPTIGFNLPITNALVATVSAGYTWRGSYQRESSISSTTPTAQAPTDINPGDVLTVTTAIGYKAASFTTKITGSISQETATIENGIPLYRPGRRYLASGSFAYAWPQPKAGLTTLTASASHSERNDVLFIGASSLIKEIMNTNSNLYRVGIEHLFALDRVSIGPTGSYLFRDHNGYDSTTLQFVPEKGRWAAGALARFAINDKLILNARFERVWTRENDHPALNGQQFSVLANAFVPGSAVPVVSSTGWQAVIGVTAGF